MKTISVAWRLLAETSLLGTLGLTRPYRWATWAAVTAWFPWGWSQPTAYSYGENIYYQDNSVYYGDQVVATADEYAQQAYDIAESAPAVTDEDEWMQLGVFAITQDGEATGPPPTMFLQLAVSKTGVIAGMFYDQTTDTVDGNRRRRRQGSRNERPG